MCLVFTDGRDHTKCCQNRGVQPLCLGLCAHTKKGALESKYLVCVPDTPQAVTCFNEGIGKFTYTFVACCFTIYTAGVVSCVPSFMLHYSPSLLMVDLEFP